MDFADTFGPLRRGGATTVRRTKEFDRIAALPRRQWSEAADLDQVIAALNKYLHINPAPCATPETCEGCKMASLRPSQAAAMREMYERGGLFAPIRPGGGKTAVSILGFTVVQAKRPLLIVPADLVGKTEKAKVQIARHWRVLPYIEIVSYQFLTHKNNANFLEEYAPSHIFADECDVLGKTGNVAWKRIKKYLARHVQSETPIKFYPASGTVMGRQVREVSHLLHWSLKDAAPLPRDLNEQITWGYAVDAKVPVQNRVDPGALLDLPGAEGDTDLAKARAAFRKRLADTPGVLATSEDVPPIPLTVNAIIPEVPAAIREAILTMRDTWVTPAGEPFKYALELWGHAKRLGLGFHYDYDPPPPVEWRMAKSEWYAWARKKIVHMTGLDQVSQLQDKILAGEVEDGGLYQRWLDISGTYDPDKHRYAHWVDDTTSFGWAKDWLIKGDGKGLIWTPDTAWGERASELLGLPYFSKGGVTKDGLSIEDFTGPAAICSVASCGRGRNLQRWSRGLIMNPSSVGKIWTQLLARMWRDGQTAETVEWDVILTSRESYSCLIQAIRDCNFAPDAAGLLYAVTNFGEIEELANRDDDLWKKMDLGV